MDIAVRNLKRNGYKEEAKQLSREWRTKWDGELIRLVVLNRDIGDFQPLSTWLAEKYEMIEFLLGYDICRVLRISDIKTINFAIPVVFHPCKYGEAEFTKHFAHGDPKYRSLAPVVAYWVTDITCSIATFGAGYFFVCSPIAMLVEFGVDRWAAPKLAPVIYRNACGAKESQFGHY